MYSSTSRLLAAMAMTLTVAACGDGNGPVPTATAPTPTTAPRSTFAVFGVVSEVTASGVVPIEGVGVQMASCPPTTRFGCGGNAPLLNVTTNTLGAYIVDGVYPGAVVVWVEKTGFQLPEGVKADGEGAQTVLVNGDTRFDVRLVRR